MLFTKKLPMTELKISRFIKLFEKVYGFHFKMSEMIIAKSRAKSTKNLKLRIRQNAYNKKVAYDRMKNKSFYQMFWKSQPFSFKGNQMISAKSRAKSMKNLKLKIQKSGINEKVAYDRIKNKSFYQTFWKSKPFSFKGNRDDNSEESSKIEKKN